MVRTRFAPSPTGSLHVGNARIAVLNWLFSRSQRGSFLLRIEDTDVERSVPGAEEGIFRDLAWLGLDWDEGPDFGGSGVGRHGPYRQSERAEHYRMFADRLSAAGWTYECWCTRDEIVGQRDAVIQAGAPPGGECGCRDLAASDVARFRSEGRAPALRFRVPTGGDVVVQDIVRGTVTFERAQLRDFILLRSDGSPTYNFAVVVDDSLMEVTHVIRGVGHLSNTPRQLLLYEALGEKPPAFAHVPQVLGADRQKLSKRHGASALADYEAEGYHPDALVNYLSLLSWSSPTGEEFLTREQLIDEISLERIGVADAVFDLVKLRWLSAKHIERMPLAQLVEAVRPHLAGTLPIPPDLLPEAVGAVRTHLSTFGEAPEQLATFFGSESGAAPMPADPLAARVVRAARERLGELHAWEEQGLAQALAAAAHQAGVRGRAFYEPLRLALTGRAHGPPFLTLLRVQGRERVLAALDEAQAAVVHPQPESGDAGEVEEER